MAYFLENKTKNNESPALHFGYFSVKGIMKARHKYMGRPKHKNGFETDLYKILSLLIFAKRKSGKSNYRSRTVIRKESDIPLVKNVFRQQI